MHFVRIVTPFKVHARIERGLDGAIARGKAFAMSAAR